MYQSLEEIYDKINYNKSSIEEYKYIENFIIKLFNDGIIEETNESDKLLWIGNYYKLNKKYNEMKKYYLMAIELNDSDAMFNLGHYYHQIEINYDEMKKYYLMAIKLNNSLAMNNLGYYYKEIKNYDEMKKYYLMAINLNNSNAMINLCVYYEDIEKTIICPISLNETNICYITKCNHEFSEEILKCKICPFCRTTIEQ